MALDALTQTGNLIIVPLASLWNSLVDILPGIIAAIIVAVIGYFVAWAIGHAVRVVLEKSGLDAAIKRAKLSSTVGHFRLSYILGEVTKWYIFIVFLQQAVSLLKLGELSALMDRFTIWLPNVIVAGLVILLGMGATHFIAAKIEEHTTVKGTRLMTRILKLVIGVMIIIIALKQIGVEVGVLENSFLLIIGAFAVGIAIALGIGLGKAMQPEGKTVVKEIKDLIRH